MTPNFLMSAAFQEPPVSAGAVNKRCKIVNLGARSGFASAEAERMGLVNRVYAADAFGPESAAYVEELASRPPGALSLTKRLLYELDGMPVPQALERAAEVNARARLSEECRTGVRRFLERKK